MLQGKVRNLKSTLKTVDPSLVLDLVLLSSFLLGGVIFVSLCLSRN